MEILEIVLWTTSLTLALAGITFGIIASINATKANKQIQELVADQMVSEEASKYFYTLPQDVKTSNKWILKKLTSNRKLTYVDYSASASATRMAPLPVRIDKHLERSEYKDLALHYIDSKKRLDEEFNSVINDFSILVENKEIPKTMIAKLVKYHEKVSIEQTAILKEYSVLTKI